MVLDVRDRVSPTAATLTALFENSPPLAKVILVAGSVVPAHLDRSLRDQFGDRLVVQRHDRPLTQAEARLLGLREVDTALAVTMDIDVLVWPGWLEPLVDRLRSTGAAVVTPLILEANDRIHTAGNLLYVNERGSKRWGHKVLTFQGMPFHGSSPTLQPAPVDYAEYHCMLVDVDAMLALGAYDPSLSHELHTGQIVAAAGREQWAEPASVVQFPLEVPIGFDDLAAYQYYWDPQRYMRVFEEFEARWGIDASEEGRFRIFLAERNDQIPFVTRMLPTRLGFGLGKTVKAVSRGPMRVIEKVRRRLFRARRRLVARRWP